MRIQGTCNQCGEDTRVLPKSLLCLPCAQQNMAEDIANLSTKSGPRYQPQRQPAAEQTAVEQPVVAQPVVERTLEGADAS